MTSPKCDLTQQHKMAYRPPCKILQMKKAVHVTACKKAQRGLPSEA